MEAKELERENRILHKVIVYRNKEIEEILVGLCERDFQQGMAIHRTYLGGDKDIEEVSNEQISS